MGMIYEYKGVEIHSYNPIGDFWTSPVDFLESMGMLVPTTVRVFYKSPHQPKGRLGSYGVDTKIISIYRDMPDMDITLCHELIHAYQGKSGALENRPKRLKTHTYEDYLHYPHELEAFWWSNEYSYQTYRREIPEALTYRSMGTKEFLL